MQCCEDLEVQLKAQLKAAGGGRIADQLAEDLHEVVNDAELK